MTVWANKATLQPGEILHLRAGLENLTGQPVQYTKLLRKDVPIMLAIMDPYDDGIETQPRRGLPFGYVSEVSSDTLEPFESVEEQLLWDLTIYERGPAFPAPQGTYTVKVWFEVAEYPSEGKPQAVYLNLPAINVVNSWSPIPPEEAKQKALAHPVVQRWLALHTGEGIAKKVGGRYYYCCLHRDGGPQWIEVGSGTYADALASTAEVTFSLLSGSWLLNFIPQYGLHQYEVAGAEVDNRTGEVVRVFPDPALSPSRWELPEPPQE